MTKTQQINALIAIEFLSNGRDIRKAVDTVCGEGTYMKLASDIWEAANAKK